jgi:iron complex transport system substrate-binding protein
MRLPRVSLVLFMVLLAACGSQPAAAPAPNEAATMAATAAVPVAAATSAVATTSSGFPVTIQNNGRTLTFAEPPKRAVSLNLHTTEIMLALGLEAAMVGTAYNNNKILPEYEDAYNRIPILAEKYPSLETLLAANPDFVYGRSSAFGNDGVAPVEELAQLGVTAYAVQGTVVNAATMDDTYADIQNIGRIFGVEQRARALIADMQRRIAETQSTIGMIDTPVRVLVYDAGEKDLFTAGQSLQTYLIALAGGKNVFDDVAKNWTTVSWEAAVQRQPEVIVINDYGETSAEAKIELLLNNSALADTPAVKNRRFVVLPLPGVFEGVRNPGAVELLARGFYPEAFR